MQLEVERLGLKAPARCDFDATRWVSSLHLSVHSIPEGILHSITWNPIPQEVWPQEAQNRKNMNLDSTLRSSGRTFRKNLLCDDSIGFFSTHSANSVFQ